MSWRMMLRRKGGHGESAAVLSTLGRILGSSEDDLFETVVAAALEGATIGEFSRALRQGDDTPPVVTPLHPRRASMACEAPRGDAPGDVPVPAPGQAPATAPEERS